MPYSYKFTSSIVMFVTAIQEKGKATLQACPQCPTHLGATKAWVPAAQATAIIADFMVLVEVAILCGKD